MSAKDLFHDLVKIALENEGWLITHDPYHIDLGFVDFYIDLGAEKLIAATRKNQKIAVEIKTFLASSTISDFHNAIGQFINYRIALEDNEPDRKLYLAIPFDIYKRFFQHPWKDNNTRIYGCVIHVDIRNDKIWIQHDGTEEAIADQLVEKGVPKKEIVIAYHAPNLRQYTDFAIK